MTAIGVGILSRGMSAVEFSRWFLAGFFVLVAAFYTVRILIARARTGRSPVSMGRPGTRHYLNYLLFRIFRIAILVVCVARAIEPGLDPYLFPIRPLWQPWPIIAGNALLAGSFLAVLGVQAYMGEHWRSGIDEVRPGRLITEGPFAWSRNPIALLIQTAQLGLFLSLPSVFTLVCLVVGVWVMQNQVRLEEADLKHRLGDAYRAYQARTPRWLGRRREL